MPFYAGVPFVDGRQARGLFLSVRRRITIVSVIPVIFIVIASVRAVDIQFVHNGTDEAAAYANKVFPENAQSFTVRLTRRVLTRITPSA